LAAPTVTFGNSSNLSQAMAVAKSTGMPPISTAFDIAMPPRLLFSTVQFSNWFLSASSSASRSSAPLLKLVRCPACTAGWCSSAWRSLPILGVGVHQEGERVPTRPRHLGEDFPQRPKA
jgi:hypothetical protein